MAYIQTNGINLYYETHGEGQPLLFIPGYTQYSSCWQAYVEPMSAHFKVIRFDPRGAGQTDAPSGEYSLSLFAHDIIGLLDALEIESAHLMGQSMGTCICQRLCIDHPDRVRKAVLCAPFAKLPAVSRHHGEQILKLYNEGIEKEALLKLNASWLFSNSFVEQVGYVDQFVHDLMHDPYPQTSAGLNGQAQALFAIDLREELHQIAHEMLLLIGGSDLLTPPSCGKLIEKTAPNCTSHVFKGMAHMLTFEIPDQVIKRAITFLKA